MAIVSLLVSIGAFIISFFPPALPGSESAHSYVSLLAGCLVVVVALPFIV